MRASANFNPPASSIPASGKASAITAVWGITRSPARGKIDPSGPRQPHGVGGHPHRTRRRHGMGEPSVATAWCDLRFGKDRFHMAYDPAGGVHNENLGPCEFKIRFSFPGDRKQRTGQVEACRTLRLPREPPAALKWQSPGIGREGYDPGDGPSTQGSAGRYASGWSRPLTEWKIWSLK